VLRPQLTYIAVIVAGRSTGSLERMRKPVNESSINAHFRREGILPTVVITVLLSIAGIMALAAPWLFERLR
jgi:hypothetical protein